MTASTATAAGNHRAGPTWAAWEQQHAYQHAVAYARGELVQRARRMNALHARHAWDQRRSDPVGPHAVGFIYFHVYQQPPARPIYVPTFATRVFPAGDDVNDLPQLLYGLCRVAGEYRAAGPFDPRVQMANRVDSRMGPLAFFAGTAVSTLDTPSGRWEDVRTEREMREANIPGRIYVLLVDGSRMIVDRRGNNEFNRFFVRSSDPIHTGVEHAVTAELDDGFQDIRLLWEWQHRLTTTVFEGVRQP